MPSVSFSSQSRGSARRRPRPIPIRRFVTRLTFLCVLPLLLLALLLAGIHIGTPRTHQDRSARDLTRNVMMTIDRDLSARIAAAAPIDEPPDLDRLYALAQGFRESFSGHVVLADTSGRMLFNTRLPLGAALPRLPVPSGFAAAPFSLKRGQRAEPLSDAVHAGTAEME